MPTKIVTFVLCLIVLSAAGILPQESRPAPLAGMPAAAGVYCLQGGAKWIKLDPALVEDSKIRSLDRLMETAGLVIVNANNAYLGAYAALELSDRRPTFYVRGVGSPKDAQIVRLTRKRDKRTVQTSSAEISVTNRGGFKRGEIQPVAVTSFSDGSFSVTPEGDLKPGEYLLAFGSAVTGFDFGISPAKK